MEIPTVQRLGLDEFVEHLHDKDFVNNMLRFPWGQNGFYANDLQIFEQRFQQLPSAYLQNFYKIYALKKGHIVKIHQAHEVEAKDSTLYLSKPGQMKKWKVVENPKGYFMIFTKSFLQGLNYQKNMLVEFPFLSPRHKGEFQISSKGFSELLALFAKIHQGFTTKDQFSYDLIQLWTLEVLILLKRCYVMQDSKLTATHPAVRISETFLEHLEEHFIDGIHVGLVQNKSVTEFAKDLQMDIEQLNFHLKLYLNKTAKVLIMDRYLLAAKCKLIHSDLPISSICWLLGFDNPSYFSRFFKKRTEMTPQQFRRRFQ